MTIKPQETATIVVERRRFDDWDTVFVQHRYNDAYPIFRFTATERDVIPTLWQRLQFKPQDSCAIYLGGKLAIAGVITVRQTAYDANSHGVMLQGCGLTWYAARGSIMDKTGSWDNRSFEEIARAIYAPFGVGVETVGKPNATKFQRLQNEPGETTWNFLERAARPLGIVLGADKYGNIQIIGDHNFPVSASLQEGDNIKQCQATISIQNVFDQYVVDAQSNATDGHSGRDTSEMRAVAQGTLKRYSPKLTPSEHPVWSLAETASRAKNEAVWSQGDEVTVNIVVQGWLKPDGDLWAPGEKVSVSSPMAMINMVLSVQCVTFTQSSQAGTLTQLELVAPWLLKDEGDYDTGDPKNPGIKPAPEDAKPDQAPAATPKPSKVPDQPPDVLADVMKHLDL